MGNGGVARTGGNGRGDFFEGEREGERRVLILEGILFFLRGFDNLFCLLVGAGGGGGAGEFLGKVSENLRFERGLLTLAGRFGPLGMRGGTIFFFFGGGGLVVAPRF